METQVLIEALKRALKLRGLNYIKLGEFLGLSERSIKRILSEGTLTLDRLLKICDFIGMPLGDLIKMVDVDLEARDFEFTLEQEEFFANNFEYVLFYNLLHQYDTVKELARDYNIDQVTIGKLLAQLEKMNLLEWLPGDEAKLFRPRKFANPNGPIYNTNGKSQALMMVEDSFANEDNRDLVFYPHVSQSTQKKIRLKMEDLYKEIRRDSEMENLLNISTEFVGVYLGVRPFDFAFDILRNLKL